MDAAKKTDDGQIPVWNGAAGQNWVEAQGLLDRMFKPLEDPLVEALLEASLLGGGPLGRVLDVGCGTGGTTLAIARRLLGKQGHCVGIDISEPMIAAARARAEGDSASASFIRADAQTYAFEPESFDMIVSRIGVMFFDDSRRAFQNLRRAARSGAELRFIAWRSAAENPFMTTAEHAAAPLLPTLPARDPDAPGQFAFADDDRVRRILEESGWVEIDIRPLDLACTLPESELADFFTLLGPLGRILPEADARTRAEVIETVRAAFDPFVKGTEVRFTAACWTVGARSPATSATPGRDGDA